LIANGGDDSYFNIPTTTELDFGNDEVTLEAWARLDIPQSQDTPFIMRADTGNDEEFMLGVDGSACDPCDINFRTTDVDGAPGSHFRYDRGPGFSDQVWTSAAMKYDGTLGSNPRMFVYKDGAQLGAGGNADGDNLLTTGNDVLIGKRVNDRFLEGDLDELRISNITRSDNYIQTRYNNEQIGSTFLTIGPEEPVTFTIKSAISASSDDAEEDTTDDSMDLTSTDLQMMQDTNLQEIGLRFTNIQVPKNAIIVSADVQFAVEVHTLSLNPTPLS